MIALHGTAHHVERLVRHYRQVEHAEELARETRQEERCRLSCWYDTDGSLIVQGRIPALKGAVFEKALEAAMEVVPATEPISPTAHPFDWDDPEEPSVALRPYGARRADALALIAESFLQHGPTTQTTADRYQVVVHIDAATLSDHKDGRCEIEHGPSIAVDTARQIACDSSLVRLVENHNGEPLNVGRKTRSIPPALRRALNARDTGCRFPGCTFDRYIDAHHVEHWADGGETKLSNLVTLCRAHHRMVHKGEVVIKAREDGAWQFLSQDGRPYKEAYRDNRPSYEWNAIHDVHEAQGVYIDARTATTRWAGERMDYDLAIFGLFSSVARARRVSAETSEP
jgi:hypothetical protein